MKEKGLIFNDGTKINIQNIHYKNLVHNYIISYYSLRGPNVYGMIGLSSPPCYLSILQHFSSI